MDLNKTFSTRWVDIKIQNEVIKFHIRHFTDEYMEKMKDRFTSIDKNGNKTVDEMAFSEASIDHVIIDWKGFTQKCTKKNKMILITNMPATANEIMLMSKIPNIFGADIEGILKNFVRLSDSSDNGQNKKEAIQVD